MREGGGAYEFPRKTHYQYKKEEEINAHFLFWTRAMTVEYGDLNGKGQAHEVEGHAAKE